jgi:hypothetical protein
VPYHTVFDITVNGYKDWTFPAHGLIFIVAGILAWRYGPTHLQGWTRAPFARDALLTFLVGFAILWTVLSFLSTYADYRHLRREFEEGRFKVVEGVVSEFDPETLGHKEERFCVQGTCFGYSTYLVQAGFNRSNVAGGPFRLGLPVRVSYVYYQIAKLEVGPFVESPSVRPELVHVLWGLAAALALALSWVAILYRRLRSDSSWFAARRPPRKEP